MCVCLCVFVTMYWWNKMNIFPRFRGESEQRHWLMVAVLLERASRTINEANLRRSRTHCEWISTVDNGGRRRFCVQSWVATNTRPRRTQRHIPATVCHAPVCFNGSVRQRSVDTVVGVFDVGNVRRTQALTTNGEEEQRWDVGDVWNVTLLCRSNAHEDDDDDGDGDQDDCQRHGQDDHGPLVLQSAAADVVVAPVFLDRMQLDVGIGVWGRCERNVATNDDSQRSPVGNLETLQRQPSVKITRCRRNGT